MNQKSYFETLRNRLSPFVSMFAVTVVFIAVVQIGGILYEAKLKADYIQWSANFHRSYQK